MTTERKRPDIGLLIILIVGLGFWSCVGFTVQYAIAYNAKHSVSPEQVPLNE